MWFFSSNQKKILADNLYKNILQDASLNSYQSDLKIIDGDFEISNSIYLVKNKVIKDLNSYGNKLFNLITFEPNDLEKNYFVEIDADKQYKDNDFFIAEGNVVIYLSNATLEGDKVKYDMKKIISNWW